MSSSSLTQIQAALASLQSFQLNERYELPSSLNPQTTHDKGSSNDEQKEEQPPPILDKVTIQRYHQARDSFLRSSMGDLFLEHLGTIEYDSKNKTNTNANDNDNENSIMDYNEDPRGCQFQYPPVATEEEKAELQSTALSVRRELIEAVSKVDTSYGNVYRKHELLCRKREELEQIVLDMQGGGGQEMNRSGGDMVMNQQTNDTDAEDDTENNTSYIQMQMEDNDDNYYNTDNDDNDEDDDDITTYDDDGELAIEDEKLRSLLAKKKELERTLRCKRMEAEELTVDVDRRKCMMKKMLEERGAMVEAAEIQVIGDVSGNGTAHPSSSMTMTMDDGSGVLDVNGVALAIEGNDGSGGEEKTDILEGKPLEEMEAENDELRRRVRELEETNDYFDSIRSVLENMGGIKVLSVTAASPPQQQQHQLLLEEGKRSSPTKSPRKKSPRISGGSSSGSSSCSSRGSSMYSPPKHNDIIDTNSNDSLCLKVLLFDKHIIAITLKSIPSSTTITSNSGGDHYQQQQHEPSSVEMFRVIAAQFQTSPVLGDDVLFPTTNGSTTSGINALTVPPMDDLVKLSANLEPIHDLRFVIRETMSRVRTLTTRVDELVRLRSKYLTKITDMPSSSSSLVVASSSSSVGGNSSNIGANRLNYGHGGDDQEVVCSLNSGITAVLHLTTDCPMLNGSAYIHQIVGMGGWDNGCLKRMRTRVNNKKSRGPLEVMDALVEEIGRVEREEGIHIPRTPVFPRRKGGGGGSIVVVDACADDEGEV